jgi:3-methyladenine DNA glycosylase AlkD
MSEGIVYQNKDILFKILGQTYKEKSFAAYGIDLPPIRELLPTDLPKIAANEKSIDNLFLLEDGTYAIVDYESVYKKANKIKYLNYIARVMEKYFQEDETFNLRLIVSTPATYKARSQRLKRTVLPCVPSRLSCPI